MKGPAHRARTTMHVLSLLRDLFVAVLAGLTIDLVGRLIDARTRQRRNEPDPGNSDD